MISTNNPYNDITDNLLAIFTEEFDNLRLSLASAPIKGRPFLVNFDELPALFIYFTDSNEDWAEFPNTLQAEITTELFYLYAREDKALEETDLGTIIQTIANVLRVNVDVKTYCQYSSLDLIRRTFRKGIGSGVLFRLRSVSKSIPLTALMQPSTGAADTGNPYLDIPDNLVSVFQDAKNEGVITLKTGPSKERPFRVVLSDYPALFIYFDEADESWTGLPSTLRVNLRTELFYLHVAKDRSIEETTLATAINSIVNVLRANLTVKGYCATSILEYVHRETRRELGTGARIGLRSTSKNIVVE